MSVGNGAQAGLDVVARTVRRLDGRGIDAQNAGVIAAYEAKIENLEREKPILADRAVKMLPQKGRLEEFDNPALEFLANPWNVYQKGSFALKRTVLRSAFSEPLLTLAITAIEPQKLTFLLRR